MSIEINRTVLTKGWQYYDIMHLNRRVARIYENGKCTIYYSSFFPYNLYFETSDDMDERINNLNNFYYWCSSRILTLDRKYAKEILNSIGASQAVTDKDRAMITISYHGLSLTDVFWIRAANERMSFEEISLYRHSLSDAFVDVGLCGKSITLQNAALYKGNDVAGDVGTQGVAPKAWIRRNGAFYLLKDGDERDVQAELLASKIVDCFDVAHVSYEKMNFENTVVSKCKIITSEEIGIVPFEHIDVYCKNKDLDAVAFVKKKDSYNYYMMNILDYLIGNTDRHWGNWGFLIDNATNKPIRLYPLMDFNKAFNAYNTLDGAICQTTANRMTQRQAAECAVKQIGLNQMRKVDPSWIENENVRSMFFQRLEFLQNIQNNPEIS